MRDPWCCLMMDGAGAELTDSRQSGDCDISIFCVTIVYYSANIIDNNILEVRRAFRAGLFYLGPEQVAGIRVFFVISTRGVWATAMAGQV